MHENKNNLAQWWSSIDAKQDLKRTLIVITIHRRRKGRPATNIIPIIQATVPVDVVGSKNGNGNVNVNFSGVCVCSPSFSGPVPRACKLPQAQMGRVASLLHSKTN